MINLLTDIAQLLDRAKQEWAAEGAWTEWDQSVRDRITGAIVKLMKDNPEQGRLVPHHGSGPDNQ
jgi:hypothetical protein